MKISKLWLIVLLLTCCNTPSKDNQLIQKNSNLKINNLDKNNEKVEQTDTLRNPNHYYYLADLDPKEVGKMILDGKIELYDNYCIFRTMDSLMAKNFDDRKFYFNVFLKIVDNADGALAEAVGLPAKKYIETHTIEFFDLSTNVPDEIISRWASYIGTEIFLSSLMDPIGEGKAFTRKIALICSELPDNVKKRINEFNEIIIKTIEEDNQ